MSKADLISRIESIDNQAILDSIFLFISQFDSKSESILLEEKKLIDIGIQQANDKILKDHSVVIANIRSSISK
jgi:hypothetical protein